jgi:hypothetical protein
LESGIKDFWRERFRHATILCVAVLNSGSCWSALVERLGENAPMKEDVCSSVLVDLKTVVKALGDAERSLLHAIIVLIE